MVMEDLLLAYKMSACNIYKATNYKVINFWIKYLISWFFCDSLFCVIFQLGLSCQQTYTNAKFFLIYVYFHNYWFSVLKSILIAPGRQLKITASLRPTALFYTWIFSRTDEPVLITFDKLLEVLTINCSVVSIFI